MIHPTPALLLEQIAFPESPRWHDGAFWFSDFYTHRVLRVGSDGVPETVVQVPGQPSGLGWLPDGRLLVVSMMDRRLLRLDGMRLSEVADLSSLAPFHCNDMVVDAQGVVSPRPLKLGGVDGGDWIVLSGLKAGEQVMVDGFQKLRPGVTVKPVPWSAASAPAAAAPAASAASR